MAVRLRVESSLTATHCRELNSGSRQKQPNSGARLQTSCVATVFSRGTDKSKLNRIIAIGMVRVGVGIDIQGVSIYYCGNERRCLPYIRSV